MEALEQVATKWIKPYPHAAWRENVEVLLVALAVAMGIRTFFLQPFKIPTGSMQPTLFGVTSTNLTLPTPISRRPRDGERVKEWFEGISYVHVVAPADGRIDGVSPMHRMLIFNLDTNHFHRRRATDHLVPAGFRRGAAGCGSIVVSRRLV